MRTGNSFLFEGFAEFVYLQARVCEHFLQRRAFGASSSITSFAFSSRGSLMHGLCTVKLRTVPGAPTHHNVLFKLSKDCQCDCQAHMFVVARRHRYKFKSMNITSERVRRHSGGALSSNACVTATTMATCRHVCASYSSASRARCVPTE